MKIGKLTVNESRLNRRVEVAKRFCGRPVVYKLGRGDVGDVTPECDCTGFASHLMGVHRDPSESNGKRDFWVESTALVKDAKNAHKLLTQVSTPVPGAFIVYGDNDDHEGHIALLTRCVDGEWHGVDCSPSNQRRTGSAIDERKLGWMVKKPETVIAIMTDDIVKAGAK